MAKHSEQIFSQPFFDEVLNDIRPVLQQLSPNANIIKVSQPEQYFWSAYYYVHILHNSFMRLEHIRAYLAHFRILKQYKESGIDRVSYIEYHYSNHTVTLAGIFDIALILTSNVFRLGLPERQCRSQLIIQNSWVLSRGIDKILQKLNSAVEPLREPRNLFLHRGIPQMDEFLTALACYDVLEEKGMVEEDAMLKMIDRSRGELRYKEKVSEILSELSKQEEPVFNISIELLSRLHPIYKFWKDILLTKRDKKID